jgi:hypothetical protein
MTPKEIHIHHHDDRQPTRKLGFLGFLGLLLVVGAVLAQPLLIIPLVVVVALIVSAAVSQVQNERKDKNGG